MMEKKRVLHLSMTKSIGGIASFQMNLFEHIDKTKISFDFVTTYPNAAMISHFKSLGAVIYHLPAQKTVLPYCYSLFKLLKKNQYDCVHIHKNSCANPMAFLICRLAGVKTIIAHSHNTQSISGGIANFFHYIFRPFVRSSSTIRLACSQAAAIWLFGKKCVVRRNVTIVKNGIDIDRFAYNESIRNDVRQEFGWDNNLVVGHVGNYIPQKNHRFMVDIFAELLKQQTESVLFFLGRGDAMNDIKKYAAEKGIAEKITFLGSRNDVNRFYQAMDIFLFPSLHEGLPIAGVEAQTAGLPCLFSDAVTDEITICQNVTQLSLDLPAEVWAVNITDIIKNFSRLDISAEISSHGYDAVGTARLMHLIYMEGCEICE